MPQFAPISYGPAVQADLQGADTALRATAQHEGAFQQMRELGSAVEGGANVIAQGLLHNQALQATANTKEVQANTLDFIDRNRVVTKAQLAGQMKPEDLDAWAAKNPSLADKEVVPMYSVAGDLYDSVMKKAHEENGNLIALPQWRENWTAVARTEAATIRERYVNRIAADQMVADNRAIAHDTFIRAVDSARTPEDIADAKAGVTGTPWFSPGERTLMGRVADARADTLAADNALSANNGLGDVPSMKRELDRISGPDAAKNFPNITEQQRLTLQRQLEHSIKTAGVQGATDEGITWARDMSKQFQLPGSAVIDRTAMQNAFKDLKGDPVKLKTAELEMNRLTEEGDRAQKTTEGRAFTRGVDEIEQTGHISAQTRSVLSNPNGTEAAGAYHERLMQLERMKDKNDPVVQLEHAHAWAVSRSALEQIRTTGTTFEQFLSTNVDQEGGTIGSTLDPKQLKPLQKLFIAKQQTEKKNDEHPLSGETLGQVRLLMKDAYKVDPKKVLTPEELTIHANIEKHLLDRRNQVQDSGGVVKPDDYAKWMNEMVVKDPEMHLLNPFSWGQPWSTKTPAEMERAPVAYKYNKDRSMRIPVGADGADMGPPEPNQ